MKDWDLSDNQFWAVVWIGLFICIFLVSAIINNNSKFKMSLIADQNKIMLEQSKSDVYSNGDDDLSLNNLTLMERFEKHKRDSK